MKTLAYYNYGRWVADCPQPGCADARAVYPEDKHGVSSPTPVFTQLCFYGHPMEIEMPPPTEAARISTELASRAHGADQAWYPRGHARAELAGYPTGQTIAELRAESAQVRRARAAQDHARTQRLAAILAEHGVTVGPDGRFEGSL